MAVQFTYHGDWPRDAADRLLELPARQSGDGVSVADAAVSAAVANAGIYRIVATTACTVRIGPALANANNGEYWPQFHTALRWLAAGDIVAVNAL